MRKLVPSLLRSAVDTVRIHVIGDGAIYAALDIFEEASDLYGLPQHEAITRSSTWRISLPQDIDRLRNLNVVAWPALPYYTRPVTEP